MKLNDKVKESFNKMTSLEIPRGNRREYIGNVYNCITKFSRLPYLLNTKLDELSQNNITSEKAVSEIDKMFKDRRVNIRDCEINNPMGGP